MALGRIGLTVSAMPDEYVAEAVVAMLKDKVAGRRVLLARAAVARDVIPEQLRKCGADIHVVEAYRTVIPADSIEQVRALFGPGKPLPDAVTFTSSSTVNNFFALLAAARIELPQGLRAVSIGPVTSKTLRQHQWEPACEASKYDIPGVVTSCCHLMRAYITCWYVATMNVPRLRIISFLIGVLFATPLHAAAPASSPDLVVYGGTASGVMTAYSAAREGLHVVLLEPGVHLGGMVTGGLSATDLGHYTIIGGYARDFYMKAAARYGVHDLDRPENWRSEPHVDEEIFHIMLQESGVTVYFHERLREQRGVQLHGKHLVSITTTDGKHWPAKIFADCSYEGDLMAQAKVSYTWGREASAEYGEDLAGVRGNTPKHQFLWPLSAYDEHHQLLPEIDPGPLAAPGSGDKKVQAYNFRLILTNDPANRLPFPRPRGIRSFALRIAGAVPQ